MQAKNEGDIRLFSSIVGFMDDDLRFRAAALRAMRAYLGLDQAEVMTETGLSQSTLTAAEKGSALSDKTWRRLCAVYAPRGVTWRERAQWGLMVVEQRSSQ